MYSLDAAKRLIVVCRLLATVDETCNVVESLGVQGPEHWLRSMANRCGFNSMHRVESTCANHSNMYGCVQALRPLSPS